MEPFRSLPLREQRQGLGSRRKPLRGEGESANEPQCRQTFVLQHRIVTLIAQNRFTVDLSGACSRCWKSKVLSIKEMNMSSKLVFKLVVEDSGKEVFSKSLSYETVANIASSYEDSDESNGFFALAAKHPASTVRENIADKDKLSEEILSLLIKDNSIPVLRNLVRTQAFKENGSADDVERLIKLDVEIAQNIAGDIDSYQQADASKLCSVILGLDDPSILVSLIGNCSTPKKVLKELLNHSDPYVASQAKKRLEN